MNFFISLISCYDEKIKFLMVGLINTFFGYTIYAFFIWIGYPALTALFIATVLGVVFNYFSYGQLVFDSKGSLIIGSKFIATYLMVYGFNSAILTVLTKNEGWNAYVAQAACLPPSVVMSWLLMHYWVYKKVIK